MKKLSLVILFIALSWINAVGQSAEGYYIRGASKNNLKDYYGAIADYTKAIELNPDYANAFYCRGIAKFIVKLDYCSDYKRACDLGLCDNYNNYCK